MLVKYNLDIVQGSTFSAQLTAKNEDGTAVDLTGYLLRGVIKYRYSDSASLVSLNPLRVVPFTDGVINVVVSAEDTSALPVTEAVYDIEMYDAATPSYVAKLLDGKVKIHPEVTNS